MTEKDFIPDQILELPESGKVTWKAPSNIALVKYWGKKPNQIPANPSISFTLDACATTTTLSFEKKKITSNGFSFDFSFEGKAKDDFKPKIVTFFERIETYLPFLKQYHLTIETHNSFPHSSGIASSASGMAALALCLLSIERQADSKMDEDFFKQKASFLARLGSGSACRSIEGDIVQWGKTSSIPESSDVYGIKYPFDTHQNFKNYHDTILLVHKGQKQVSSSVGHDLMHVHPFAERRFQQAHDNLERLKTIFSSGDIDTFIQIVEGEALTLHAMMMTGSPYFMLMKPNTLEIINKIWQYREANGNHVCFTLDAGANVHVLYPEAEKEEIFRFIQKELVQFCENGHYICDRIGFGAKKL
ncbi:diphosphomevalonate/mevalonate 3,5-bisphosphate decarboxylase family protein [Allomuricauda sp. SCSIO 65647]|uniref:diphosphomevalonate/mevalonate 3,5-bisphosphate decarboxylase family protein n=1 Tax=Allomuricauda sp. SCSIO 65647 TaxID=2908843 RepID=UPI001F1CDA69|nr:diphosphomevalonate decarboxylase [Muricauda sp. SCSIO 65647]UJH66257.1 diphosphomevalonate decarboxylase [Muricauda sp. SCSIO 65647]